MELIVLNTDYTEYMYHNNPRFDCIFADPPDNIGLGYGHYADRKEDYEYWHWLKGLVHDCYTMATTTWLSYNAKHIDTVAEACVELRTVKRAETRHMVQTFTFGQHRSTDFGNNFRPMVRVRQKEAPLYPDSIRVESARQRMGDKRANPAGRVPGDVFEFTRVTGNSKQRRKWHPTQLNEGLVERCLLSCCAPGDTVFDPFMGTGTTLRVCKRLGLNCVTTDVDGGYCEKVAAENGLRKINGTTWKLP